MFEHIISTLLDAKHDVKLPCRYEGELIERQFDGYKVIKPNPLTTIQVGIECKKLSRPVEVGDIESFITKRNDCHIDTAIFVSFIGYQRAAIASAKKNGITLYNFHLSSIDDIAEFPFSKIVGAIYDFKFNSKAPPKSISRQERALLSMRESKFFDNFLYDKNGEKLIKDIDFINNLIEPYVLEKSYSAEILNIDLSEKGLYLRAILGEKRVFLKIYSVEIIFRKIGPTTIKNPKDWFILEDIINQKQLLVKRKYVEKIRAMYHNK